jgi:1-acyl-sn-glycerol-3-phosphate acyltransferase
VAASENSTLAEHPETSAARARLEKLGREGHQQPNPGGVDPVFARKLRRYLLPIVRLAFRPELEGAENAPREGAYLMVANHSGLGNPDIACFVACFLDNPSIRFPAAMVHPVSFNSGLTGPWVRSMGAVPSTYDAALGALAAGVPVLVFPGGDVDATRPIWQANQVQFGSRKGFLKIARSARVPIVPLGFRGTHYAAPILFRSALLSTLLVLPRMNGVRRFPVTLLGVLGGAGFLALAPVLGWILAPVLAVAWIVLPVSQVPWIPWKARLRVGKPIPPEELFPDESDAALERAYEHVRGTVQALIALTHCR